MIEGVEDREVDFLNLSHTFGVSRPVGLGEPWTLSESGSDGLTSCRQSSTIVFMTPRENKDHVVSTRLTPEVYSSLTATGESPASALRSAASMFVQTGGVIHSQWDYDLLRDTLKTVDGILEAHKATVMTAGTVMNIRGIIKFALDKTEGGEIHD